MADLLVKEFHESLGATFTEVNGQTAVAHYGDWLAEYTALQETAGVIDLSFRSRLCLLGADRIKFLHGQVTNDVNRLQPGQGCYAMLVNAKGRVQSDLHIHRLREEILLDFEPGLTETVTQRLDAYIIADDVQIVDAAPHYSLLSIQGPQAAAVAGKLALEMVLPANPLAVVWVSVPDVGEIYCVNQPRLRTTGLELYVPVAATGMVLDKLVAAAKSLDGRACGWQALETARIEGGIPRFGQDITESNLAPEAGVTERAISYSKGCYIGQEVIARIRTYGQVTKELRGLQLADALTSLPAPGDKVFRDGKEVGYLTSVVRTPKSAANLALGYVRKECNTAGTELLIKSADRELTARIVDLPLFRS